MKLDGSERIYESWTGNKKALVAFVRGDGWGTGTKWVCGKDLIGTEGARKRWPFQTPLGFYEAWLRFGGNGDARVWFQSAEKHQPSRAPTQSHSPQFIDCKWEERIPESKLSSFALCLWPSSTHFLH